MPTDSIIPRLKSERVQMIIDNPEFDADKKADLIFRYDEWCLKTVRGVASRRPRYSRQQIKKALDELEVKK